jgi:hypothetical protein
MAINEFFRAAFTKDDLIDTSTVATITGQYVRLGTYVVTAGEIVAVGYGRESGQENAQGRIYGQFKDGQGTPALIPGTVRLSIYSAQDRPMEIMHEFRTETLDTSSTDRTKQIPFPVYNGFVSEDKKIVLEFKADTGATLTRANCTLILDVTKGIV